MWARLHVATGLRRDEFERLEISDLAALHAALSDRYRSEAKRDARFMALLCNLLAGGKKTWTENDFFEEVPRALPQESDEARQVIEAYRAEVAEGRKRESGKGLRRGG
ncbi:MAG: hypothetical protein EOP83_30355 [Verrucomicrobiaceae bacterium]|nr:MAG: hypothetical protein EOP83_30355 [Verrucomicrobiaceae bacterium]